MTAVKSQNLTSFREINSIIWGERTYVVDPSSIWLPETALCFLHSTSGLLVSEGEAGKGKLQGGYNDLLSILHLWEKLEPPESNVPAVAGVVW